MFDQIITQYEGYIEAFATHLLMQGVNIRQVQDYLGHANLETTI